MTTPDPRIQIGDTVRCFDYPRMRDLRGNRASYAEGTVDGMVEGTNGIVFVIRVVRDVSAGRLVTPGRETVHRLISRDSDLPNSVVLLSVHLPSEEDRKADEIDYGEGIGEDWWEDGEV